MKEWIERRNKWKEWVELMKEWMKRRNHKGVDRKNEQMEGMGGRN